MILDESRVLIRTENLYKSYKLGKENKEAVKNLDIRIMQGEFIIIEGLTGKQKNEFFNLIGCLVRPDAGKYYFDYEDIALAKADTLDGIRRNKIGYLFRDFNLVARMTAAQNIEIPMLGLNIPQQGKRDRLLAALRSLGIEGIAEEKAGSLSDCQKQLVALARAVVNNPLMIIADEPAANLDRKEGQILLEHLFRLNKEGVTIILITEKEIMKEFSGYRMITFENGMPVRDKETRKLSLVRREA